MAKANIVDLCGMVLNPPMITEKKDKGSFILVTTRGNRDTGSAEQQVRWDCIVVSTKDPDMINEMDKLDKLDIVRIKCVISTKVLPKKSICEHCGSVNIVEGLYVYVEPIYIEKILHALDEEDAKNQIYIRREISNEARVIGNICNVPTQVDTKKATICQYQLAIPRTYRVKGSTDDDKTDYPWVKSYGRNASEDLKRLKQGSRVLIDGCLQARNQIKKTKCVYCEKEYEYADKALEVVPYETEYLKDYITDDDLGISPIIKDEEISNKTKMETELNYNINNNENNDNENNNVYITGEDSSYVYVDY